MNVQLYLKILLGSVIGNITEWYEFAVVSLFAPIIAPIFFPSAHPALSVLAAFGAFAIGFLVRPIGSVIFGYIGDTLGREVALTLSIISMGISTFLVGLLPTYSKVGMIAPLLFVFIRMVQGVCIGGEFGGSLTYLVENAIYNKRGVAAGVVVGSAFLGMILASGICALISTSLSNQEITNWAWRIPFLLGLLVAFVGYLLRRHLPSSVVFQQLVEEKKISGNPLAESFSIQFMNILKVIGLTWLCSIIIYQLFIFMPSYVTVYLKVPLVDSLVGNSFSMFVLLVACIVSGWLSDKYGRKPMLMAGTILLLIFSYPIYYLIVNHPNLIVLSQALLGVFGGLFLGPSIATWPELFPTRIRYSAVSIGYNIGFAIFGGTAPLVAFYLIVLTHKLTAPAFYVIFVCLFTLFLLSKIDETAFLDIK